MNLTNWILAAVAAVAMLLQGCADAAKACRCKPGCDCPPPCRCEGK